MKIIITENKLNDVVFKWLDNRLDNLTIFKDRMRTLYIKNDVTMIVKLNKHPKYNIKINYEFLFSNIMNVFSLNREQTSTIIGEWIKDRLKIKVKGDVQPLFSWEDYGLND
jgi:hypothetical protein